MYRISPRKGLISRSWEVTVKVFLTLDFGSRMLWSRTECPPGGRVLTSVFVWWNTLGVYRVLMCNFVFTVDTKNGFYVIERKGFLALTSNDVIMFDISCNFNGKGWSDWIKTQVGYWKSCIDYVAQKSCDFENIENSTYSHVFFERRNCEGKRVLFGYFRRWGDLLGLKSDGWV